MKGSGFAEGSGWMSKRLCSGISNLGLTKFTVRRPMLGAVIIQTLTVPFWYPFILGSAILSITQGPTIWRTSLVVREVQLFIFKGPVAHRHSSVVFHGLTAQGFTVQELWMLNLEL